MARKCNESKHQLQQARREWKETGINRAERRKRAQMAKAHEAKPEVKAWKAALAATDAAAAAEAALPKAKAPKGKK